MKQLTLHNLVDFWNPTKVLAHVHVLSIAVKLLSFSSSSFFYISSNNVTNKHTLKLSTDTTSHTPTNSKYTSLHNYTHHATPLKHTPTDAQDT